MSGTIHIQLSFNLFTVSVSQGSIRRPCLILLLVATIKVILCDTTRIMLNFALLCQAKPPVNYFCNRLQLSVWHLTRCCPVDTPSEWIGLAEGSTLPERHTKRARAHKYTHTHRNSHTQKYSSISNKGRAGYLMLRAIEKQRACSSGEHIL